MLFNSVNFALFFPVIFGLYWFAAGRNPKLQNLLLLLASYFFYACWDWRFLFLLIFSTLLDFFTGIRLGEASGKKQKQYWLWLSIIINLGFLSVFKYFNFFAGSFADALSLAGLNVNPWTLKVLLPVGISFYTFHGLSYVIDIYKGRIEPEKSFADYSVFVSFFPLLVAGPIERATHLLPQIKRKRHFEYVRAVDGLKQILWGLFKKVVIADNAAVYVNMVFNQPGDYSGSSHALAAVLFAFQIYCDFSGYSDIALGTARLLGIELLRNFAFPYFSRDIAEFWRRWHISLSSWFKDYLYIPLGGSKGGTWLRVRNTFIIFLVSGFWHGANWTFVVWGALNALYIMPSILRRTNRINTDIVAVGRVLPRANELFAICSTFALTFFAWIFFRAATIHEALEFTARMFSSSLLSVPQNLPVTLLLLIVLFVITEWKGREQQYATAKLTAKLPRPAGWSIYYLQVLVILYFAGSEQQFIYFQF